MDRILIISFIILVILSVHFGITYKIYSKSSKLEDDKNCDQDMVDDVNKILKKDMYISISIAIIAFIIVAIKIGKMFIKKEDDGEEDE